MSPLVSVTWLADRLGADDLVVFDATKFLPNEGRDGAAEYTAGHVPGARFFDIDVVADPDTTLPHMVPSAGRFERLMGGMGVHNNDTIVFYDAKGIASSPRGWWLMTLFGHAQVAVLDGGLPAWRRAGQPVEAGPPPRVVPAEYRASLRNEMLRGIGDMLRQDTDRVVLDARAAGRFAGTAPEPRAGLVSGHMPGSISLPFTELLAPDGTMLPADALRARLRDSGVDGSRPVVTSCGTGVTATILTLAMVQAGLPAGAVYDGSWTEWASRSDTPKETSDAG